MQSFAINAANLIVNQIPSNRLPSTALIGQFRLFLRRDNFANSSGDFINLAEEKFTKHEINISHLRLPVLQNQQSLPDLFKDVWRNRKSITRQLAEDHAKEIVRYDDSTRQAIINKLADNNSEEMCIMFYNHLLTAMPRESQLQKLQTE